MGVFRSYENRVVRYSAARRPSSSLLVEVKVEALTEGRPAPEHSGAVIFLSARWEVKVGNLAGPK